MTFMIQDIIIICKGRHWGINQYIANGRGTACRALNNDGTQSGTACRAPTEQFRKSVSGSIPIIFANNIFTGLR